MLSPKQVSEINPIFDNVMPNCLALKAAEVLKSASAVCFPRRTIPYPLVCGSIAVPVLESLARNRGEHYAPPGRLASMNRLWTFDKLTPSLRDFKAGRASHAAVEQIYHHEYGVWRRDTLAEKFTALAEDLTWNTDHALGLIGRFCLVGAILRNALQSGKLTSLCSIACGSGEAVIDALRQARTPVAAAFIDTNPEALKISEQRASGLGNTHFFQMNAVRNQRFFRDLPFEALEFTGLIDYLPDAMLVNFLRALKQERLKLLLASNILRKAGPLARLERAFLYHALQWNMIYRTHAELSGIFAQAGFSGVRFMDEPYGLFTVIVWCKE